MVSTTACKWDTIIPFEPLWVQYKRMIKDRGAIVLTASQPFTTALINSNFSWFKYELIWQKERGQNYICAKKQPLKSHENILLFYERLPTYNPQMEEAPKKNIRKPSLKPQKSEVYGIPKKTGKNYDISKRYPKSVLFFSSGRARDKEHPTQKPVALFEYLIKTYTNPGDIVLDNCIGSGTTAVAALNTGRFFIGIEKEPKYVEIARRRVEEAGRQEKMFKEV